MAIKKVKVSSLPTVGDIANFEVLGVDKATGHSARATMPQLRGNVGAQGAKGDKGDTGAQGVQGLKGDTGSKGASGTNGTDGKSAYQSAVSGGFIGTEAAFNTSIASIGNLNTALDAINRTVV